MHKWLVFCSVCSRTFHLHCFHMFSTILLQINISGALHIGLLLFGNAWNIFAVDVVKEWPRPDWHWCYFNFWILIWVKAKKNKLVGKIVFTVMQLHFSVTLRCKVTFLRVGIISKMNNKIIINLNYCKLLKAKYMVGQ